MGVLRVSAVGIRALEIHVIGNPRRGKAEK
jgi:hypothetical protein